MMSVSRAATTADYRRLARRRLPRFLFDYLDGAAVTELTAERNIADVDALLLRQRVMQDVSQISTRTTLFGQDYALPVILGPVGLAGLMARRGEVQAAASARQAGIPFCLSTLGVCALDEVAPPGDTSTWFQLYMMRDRGFMRDLLTTTAARVDSVLVLTADVAVSGIRYRDRRSGLSAVPGSKGQMMQAWQALTHPRWLWDVFLRGRPLIFGNIAPALPDARTLADFWVWLGENFDARLSWDDLNFVRQHWSGPIVVKGILDPEDARCAIAAGADGIIVSNHGGRQLDGVRSTVGAMPGIVEAVDGRVPLFLDGGIRSGIDVLKGLALGATACLLGRAWAYPLAAGGQGAVDQMLRDLEAELRLGLALSGCTDSNAAGSHLLDRTGA